MLCALQTPSPPLCVSSICTFQSSCDPQGLRGEPSRFGPPRGFRPAVDPWEVCGRASSAQVCCQWALALPCPPACGWPETLPPTPPLPGAWRKAGGRPHLSGTQASRCAHRVPRDMQISGTATRKGVGTRPTHPLPPAQIAENRLQAHHSASALVRGDTPGGLAGTQHLGGCGGWGWARAPRGRGQSAELLRAT